MIFSKSWCPYCKKAKATFEELNKEYKAIELDLDEGKCCFNYTKPCVKEMYLFNL
jgi:glutaredoxin